MALEIGSVSDLWLYDLPGNTITQMTQNAGFLYWPAWSANGSGIVFSSSLGGRAWNLFDMAATGGRPRRLTTSDRQQEVGAVAPDGRSIVFAETGDLFVLPIDAAGTPGTLVQMTTTPEEEEAPRISPDGRWVAYTSNQSGRDEVFVRAYPSGRFLMWRADRRDRLTLILNWPEALERIETSGAAK